MLKNIDKINQCKGCPVIDGCICSVSPNKVDSDILLLNEYKMGFKSYKKKEIISINNSKFDKVITIVSGWVLEYFIFSDGQRSIINIYTPGDIIGFSETENKINKSIYRTATNTKCCIFNKKALHKFVSNNPDVASRLIKKLTLNFSKLTSSLAFISRTNAKSRILFLIYNLANKTKNLTPYSIVGKEIDIPLSQEDVADVLGMSIVHVSRTIRSLREEKMLTVTKNTYKILSLELIEENIL